MDFGCIKAGYCSDMTRTVAVGFATEEMQRVYRTVLAAQEAGIAAAKAGVTGREVDGAARKVIEQAGYGEYFGHSFGHGVGVEIHEFPNASPLNDKPLIAGAVLSAEPGIYLPGALGVRIEDVIVIRENGCTDITMFYGKGALVGGLDFLIRGDYSFLGLDIPIWVFVLFQTVFCATAATIVSGSMFEFLINKLKTTPRKIVFTEGTDPRILEASARLLSGTFLTPVLVGKQDAVQKAAEESGFNIRGAEIIDPETFPEMEKMVATLAELRKGKMSDEECRANLKKGNYFGTMGQALNRLSDTELDQAIEQYCVYARVQPEHKVRIVEAWKRRGQITAMRFFPKGKGLLLLSGNMLKRCFRLSAACPLLKCGPLPA